MYRKDKIDAFGAGILIAFSLLLGLNQALVKIVNGGLQPIFQAGARSALAFFPILLFALLTKKKLSISDGSLVPGIICGVFFASEFMLLFTALEYTTVSRASVFFYTMPFWVAVGSHFLIAGETLTPMRIVGLGLAFVGVILAVLIDAEPASEFSLFGDILCLIGAMFWAAIALMARLSRLNRASPEMAMLYQLFVSAIIMIPIAVISGPVIREFTPMIAGIFAFQVLIVISVGFLVWFWTLTVYPASDIASFSFLAPVFGVFFGWLIFDEPLYLSLFAALLLVSIGIVLINRKPKT